MHGQIFGKVPKLLIETSKLLIETSKLLIEALKVAPLTDNGERQGLCECLGKAPRMSFFIRNAKRKPCATDVNRHAGLVARCDSSYEASTSGQLILPLFRFLPNLMFLANSLSLV